MPMSGMILAKLSLSEGMSGMKLVVTGMISPMLGILSAKLSPTEDVSGAK